jgi:hypothetical protein
MPTDNMSVDNPFNPSELCSRKLWELISSKPRRDISEAELHEAVAELAIRRRYLSELKKIGKLAERF